MIGKILLTCAAVFVLVAAPGRVFGQMNIGALAQFKANQQKELARKLQGSAASLKAKDKAGKRGKHANDVPLVIPKPALIKAQNRTFKGNYSDMRRSNMR